MNYSTTNSSGPRGGAFSANGGGFVAFCALLKLIPAYIPGWSGSGLLWCITVLVSKRRVLLNWKVVNRYKFGTSYA